MRIALSREGGFRYWYRIRLANKSDLGSNRSRIYSTRLDGFQSLPLFG